MIVSLITSNHRGKCSLNKRRRTGEQLWTHRTWEILYVLPSGAAGGGKHITGYELPVLCSGEEENREGRTLSYLKATDATRGPAELRPCISKLNLFYTGT